MAVAGLYGKPQVVLEGAPAEQPAGVPPDPGDMHLEVLLREAGLKDIQRLHGQRPEGPVQMGLVFIPVGIEPLPVVVHGQAPQEVPCGLGKAMEHRQHLFLMGSILIYRGLTPA